MSKVFPPDVAQKLDELSAQVSALFKLRAAHEYGDAAYKSMDDAITHVRWRRIALVEEWARRRLEEYDRK